MRLRKNKASSSEQPVERAENKPKIADDPDCTMDLAENSDDEFSATSDNKNRQISSGEEKDLVEEDRRFLASIRASKDTESILLLLFLYFLQGIPVGISSIVPLVLSSRGVSYAEQAMFSIASWPFSLKLLWAPIVDSWWSSRIGRRKTWTVASQYLLAMFMILFSSQIDNILGDEANNEANSNSNKPNVALLTFMFFCTNVLSSTQDIAVDGWALTMLSKKSIGHSSTVNTFGILSGFFTGHVIFLSLESKDFCNDYLRSTPIDQGLTTFPDFLYFWAWVYLISTTLVLIFKDEKEEHNLDYEREDEAEVATEEKKRKEETKETKMGIGETYHLLWKIMCLKPVLTLAVVHLTIRIGYCAVDTMTALKLTEMGMTKDKLAILSIPLAPVQIFVSWVVTKYSADRTAFSFALNAHPFKMLYCLIIPFYIYWTPLWRLPDESFPAGCYALLFVLSSFNQAVSYCLSVPFLSFHAQISDPVVGGTYMTLLNTLMNVGAVWPQTLVLLLAEVLTWKNCVQIPTRNDTMGPPVDPQIIMYAGCQNVTQCSDAGGSCQIETDGYYPLSVCCAAFGLIWWFTVRKGVGWLQTLPESDWSCSAAKETAKKKRKKI